jgi:hypothetical protein
LRIEFIAAGSPTAASRAIEECARGQGNVSAIVVPWESDASVLSMAVTLITGDGWAIEHTNLGTIRLTAAGMAGSRVTIVPDPRDHPEPRKLAAFFDRFVAEVRRQLDAASVGNDQPPKPDGRVRPVEPRQPWQQ